VYSGWHLCPLGQAKDAVLDTGRIVAEDPLNLPRVLDLRR